MKDDECDAFTCKWLTFDNIRRPENNPGIPQA